jgi:hypothetical protein
MTPAGMRVVRRVLAVCLAFSVVMCFSVRVRPPVARAQGGPAELVIAIVGIIVGVVTTAVATAAALSKSQPGIHIDDFSLAVADDFNVGDHGTINLQVSVSYGGISDSLSGDETGTTFVSFYADGQLIGQKQVTQTGEPVVRSYTFKADVVGIHPGSTNVTAKIGVSGQIANTISDDWTWVEQETPTRVLNVKEPYDVWIDGPRPNDVIHGESCEAKLKTRVRTEDYGYGKGLVGHPTQLDGTSAPVQFIAGAANAGDSYEKVLVAKTKKHDGCGYTPPHPPFVNLLFKPNSYDLYAFFLAKPYWYEQEANMEQVWAKDNSLGAPYCPEGQVWNPDKCQCEPRSGTPTPTPGNNQPPSANPGGPYQAFQECAPFQPCSVTQSFDGGASSDPDGSIVRYDWEFGDGQTGSGQTVQHTYVFTPTQQENEFTVCLTVTDNRGAQSTRQCTKLTIRVGT